MYGCCLHCQTMYATGCLPATARGLVPPHRGDLLCNTTHFMKRNTMKTFELAAERGVALQLLICSFM